jgi:probable phosphoglycerate mutase
MVTPQGGDNGCTLYLVRHGDSRRDGNRRYIGQCDPSLNPHGRAGARFLQLQLAHIDFRRVYCSDLRRCRETARIVAGRRGLRIRPVSALREIDLGDWDGLTVAEVRRRFPGEYERRGRDLVTYRPPSGESFADLQARVMPVFFDIIRRETGPVLLVGHAGVNRVILCHALNRSLDGLLDIPQSYACLNIIRCHADGLSVQAINIPADPAGWEQCAGICPFRI